MYKDCSHSNILLKPIFGFLCLSFLSVGACTASEGSLEVNTSQNHSGKPAVYSSNNAPPQISADTQKVKNQNPHQDKTRQEATTDLKNVELQPTLATLAHESELIPLDRVDGQTSEADSISVSSKLSVGTNHVGNASINVSVPKDAFNIKLIETEKHWFEKHLLGLLAIAVSIGSIFYNVIRDKASLAASKKDGFWFREMISPNYMVPMLELLNEYQGKYNELIASTMSEVSENPDDESIDPRVIEFMENWDSELDKVNQSSFYLKVMTSGADAKDEIKVVQQKLLQTITNRLFSEEVATIPGEATSGLYSNPFIDASSDLIGIFAQLQVKH